MNPNLISVKSAIEHVIDGQVAVCLAAVRSGSYAREHFTAMAETVEKFVASLYVLGRIDREFSVESSSSGLFVKVAFATQGHCSYVHSLLPSQLLLKSNIKAVEPAPCPLPEISYVQFEEYQDTVAEFNQQRNLIKEQTQAEEFNKACQEVDELLVSFANSTAPIEPLPQEIIDAYERAKKFLR